MNLPIYIYDPTQSDSMSKVRGVGRYIEVLKDYLGNEVVFTSNIRDVPFESVFITPFFSFLHKPLFHTRIAKRQLAVIHDLIPQKYREHFPVGIKGNILAFYNRFMLNNFDGVITDSKTSKEDILDILGYKRKNVHILYPVVSKQLSNAIFKSKVTIDVKPPYFIYVGDVTWNKNIANLAQAIKIADVKCVFIGSIFQRTKIHSLINNNNPWLHELQLFYQEIENDNRFILQGFVSNEELGAYYRNAEANLLVSRDEGFGFSYLEAAYADCPSVLADIPIFHETAGDSALFANPENPVEIAEKIKAIQDQSVKKSLQKKIKEQLPIYDPKEFEKTFFSIVDTYRKVE